MEAGNLEDGNVNLKDIFTPKSRAVNNKDGQPVDEVWSLVQVAPHPHPVSLFSIVSQLVLQHSLPNFVTPASVCPVLCTETQDIPQLNKVSEAGLISLFELLHQVQATTPALIKSVLETTVKFVEDLPPKSFAGNGLNAEKWRLFLESVTKSTNDANAVRALLCTAVLQNTTAAVLSALHHVLDSRIPKIQVCKVLGSLQERARDRLLEEEGCREWWSGDLGVAFVTFPVPLDKGQCSMVCDGLYVYIYSNGQMMKYSTGLGGVQEGILIKKTPMPALELQLYIVNGQLVGLKTGKVRCFIVIDKTTLTQVQTIKLDTAPQSKLYFGQGSNLSSLSGDWSKLELTNYTLDSTTTKLVGDAAEEDVSVTNPSLYTFGTSLTDNDKQGHTIFSENVSRVSGTDAYTMMITDEGKLMFRGNADEIGTGQGLIDKWIEITIGSVNKFRQVACPHQEKYAIMISTDGKPYITGHVKKGVDGDMSKPKKKPAASRPRPIDRIKDKVLTCAAGHSTSAFVTEKGQLYMFGSLGAPFDAYGLVPQFSVLPVQDVSLGHNHAAILTQSGVCFTMGANGHGQCGRNYSGNPDAIGEEEDSESDDGMCDPNTHAWKNILCMICLYCGECSGYGSGCCRNGEPGRDPGLECGCGAGDSGCSICGCCKQCAKDAALQSKVAGKSQKFKPKLAVDPDQAVKQLFKGDDSDESSNSSQSDDEEDDDEEDEEDEEDDEEKEEALEVDVKEVVVPEKKVVLADASRNSNPTDISKLPAPVKVPAGLTVKQVSCGLHHTAILLSNGDVLGFGSNAAGQLGLGNVNLAHVPTKMELSIPAQEVSCGSSHTIVLADQKVFTCGKYLDGQLGRSPSDWCAKRASSVSSKPSSPHKGWNCRLEQVPGFGVSDSRQAMHIKAVGNRTFVQCRKPLLSFNTEFENVEVLVEGERYVLVVREKGKTVLLSLEKNERWRSNVTDISAESRIAYDSNFSTVWVMDKGFIEGYHARSSANEHDNIVMLKDSLLPLAATNISIEREAFCFSLLSHLAAIAHPPSATAAADGAVTRSDKFSTVSRFALFGGGWGYSGKSCDAILFTAEKEISLNGLNLYGGRGNYAAKLKIFDIGYGGPESDGDLIYEMPLLNFSCKPKTTFSVLFDEPLQCLVGTWYRILVKIDGPSSDCGNGGKREVTCDGVKFTFRSSKKSSNGTDYGSGQIPGLIFSQSDKDNQQKEIKHVSNSTDTIPLGDWPSGLKHLLSIISMTFTALKIRIPSPQKIPMSLNLSSLTPLQSRKRLDPLLGSSEVRLRIGIDMLDIYLTVADQQQASVERTELLAQCQDLLSSILKCNLAPTSTLVKDTTRIYSKHFHLSHATPQHYWAVFFNAHAHWTKYCTDSNILAAILQAMVHQGAAIAHELCYYGTVNGLIVTSSSVMSLGTEAGTDNGHAGDEEAASEADFDVLNNVTYRRAMNQVIALSIQESPVGAAAKLLIKTIFQQISLASVENYGPLAIATNKETASRFETVSLQSWNITPKNSQDAICFTVSQPNIFLSGIGVYQSTKDTSCDVELLVKDSKDAWSTVLNHSGTLKKSQSTNQTNRLLFKKPLKLKPDIQYAVKVQQYCGSVVHGESEIVQNEVIGPDGIKFTFSDCTLSTSGTSTKKGQIPFLVYKMQIVQDLQETENNEKYETVALQLTEIVSTAFYKTLEQFTMQDSAALPEFMVSILSYAQLIFLKGNTPKSSYLLLQNVLKPLLSSIAEYNQKDKTKLEEKVETAIVESEHPYPEATLLHYQTSFSDSVKWMVVEFSPETGIGPGDCLQMYLPGNSQGDYLPIGAGGEMKPLLSLGSAKDWPRRALLLPGNRVSFLLHSITKVNKQQLNNSEWGFSCKITGYTWTADKSLIQLEHIVADLAGVCVRIMISPPVTAHKNLTQQGQYAFTRHSDILDHGLFVSTLPSYSALQNRSFLHEEPNELSFLRGFISGSKSTSGGRLALWLDPTKESIITYCHIELAQYDGEDQFLVNQTYPIVTCTQDKDKTVVFPIGAKVTISILRKGGDVKEVEEDSVPSYEEDRFNIGEGMLIPTLKDAHSYNNGFYSAGWTPKQPGLYEIKILVDGVYTESSCSIEIVDKLGSPKKPIKTKKSEQLLDEYRKKRKQAESNIETPVEYEVTKCGSMGHTVRGATATSSVAIGLLKSGAIVLVTKTETTAEGVWGKLHTKSIEQYCRGGVGEEGYTLLSTPLKTYLTQKRDITADANQVFILPTMSMSDVNLSVSSNPVIFEHPTKQNQSDYSLAFASNDSLLEEGDVKCVNSTNLTHTIRTVFAAYLWHYSSVHDAMAAAAYIKFEQADLEAKGKADNMHRQLSHPIHLSSRSLNPLTERKKRTSSMSTNKLTDAEDKEPAQVQEEVTSLKMLCNLWDSVKELVMVCATTKMTPHVPTEETRDNKPKRKKSKKKLKEKDAPPKEQMCDLCNERVPAPVTEHMKKVHPGCKANSFGMGYNSGGIYCSGWSGQCGESGKGEGGNSTWYLLCQICSDAYKLENAVNEADVELIEGNGPSVSTFDMEQQLLTTRDNARFLLSLAPLVEDATPENLDIGSFMEEAMETEPTKNKFRSLQPADHCLHPTTPLSPNTSPHPATVRRSTSKLVRSLSVHIIPTTKAEPMSPNILHNPSPQLIRLSRLGLEKGKLCKFLCQQQPLQELEEELIVGVEKAWSVSKGLLAADWLLRTVSSLPVLHSVLWRLYVGLLPDPASAVYTQSNSLLPLCKHPISSSIKCYDNCVRVAFRTVMQSLADLLAVLPSGSDMQKVAISCWNLEFRPEDHKFLQDSHVFSHIHRLLTSASQRESPVALPSFQQSVEVQPKITVSSREALTPYLLDKKTDTFWESGDKDNWLNLELSDDKIHSVAVYLNNAEDNGYITTRITVKVGTVPKVFKQLCQKDLPADFAGWLWFEITGYSQVELLFTPKSDHVRIRQLACYAGVEEKLPTSAVISSQQYALQVFRMLTNDVLKNITQEGCPEPGQSSCDLKEHLVSILFEQSHLNEMQNKLLQHVVSAIRKQAVAITDMRSFNDDYCFELLSLVSALSGSKTGCFNLVNCHDSLLQDIFKLLHLGTTRIQRQVILLLRRVLDQVSPHKLATITSTHVPSFPFEGLSNISNYCTVLNVMLAYVMKSIKLFVKHKKSSKEAKAEDYSYTTTGHIKCSEFWVKGTVEKCLADDVVLLVQDMIKGKFSPEWKEAAQSCLSFLVFSLTTIPEERRTVELLVQSPMLWLALAALSVMDESLMSSMTVEKDSGSTEVCDNHDDARTKAIISCNKCGHLCADCDKYLHLSRKSKSHQRQLFKAAEASLVLNKHENMCRAKLYWIMCVVDINSNKAVIEFKNSYGTQSEGLVCRFCNEVGESHPEGGALCHNEECHDKFKVSCKKVLPCQHLCGGNVDEEQCLPCLKNCAGDAKQDADDICVICFTESLGCAPCVQLECDHILHTHCIETVITKSWNGPRITFSFLGCPICKKVVKHPYLEPLMAPILVLMEDVRQKSLMRLKYDGINSDNEDAELAMSKYAYYQCYKCNKAYYGGEAQCQADAGDEFNPEDLVCGGCSNVSQQVCPKHGSDYLEHKCRYCCSVAVFFCFGSTHFCTPCHDDFVRLRTIKQDELPPCPVGPKAVQLDGPCPLSVDHPPTGEEFALGCGVCRNMQTF